MTDTLEPWEKWPVAALFVASGLYIAEWYAGARLGTVAPAWLVAWASTLGGLAAAVAVDGAMIATVAGMRAGRRGPWSYAAIVVTALFGSSVALVLHGALPAWVGAWLHAGFVVSAAVYLLHLAQPAQRAQVSHRPAQLRALVRRLVARVRQERDRAATPALHVVPDETIEISGRRVNVSRLAREMGVDRKAVYRMLDRCAEEAA